MRKIKLNNLGLNFWVKVSVIMQAIIAILVSIFTYYQFCINRDMGKRYILDKSFYSKNYLADIIFENDKTKNEVKLRNMLEWLQEEVQ